MIRKLMGTLAILLSSTLLVAQSQSTSWLHVRVEEGEQGKSVKINLPLSLAESVLPLIETPELKAGKIKIDTQELSVADMRKIWATLKAQGEYPLVEVNSPEANVQVTLKGGELLVTTTEGSEKQVFIQVPAAVIEALLSGEGDELNLQAAIQALQQIEPREIVRVQDQDKTVRVWIDRSSGSE
ncbi:MAG: hypothetical protein Kow00109_28350 [Acidobacteriota bacterium]